MEYLKITKNPTYSLEYNGKKYDCKTLKEMSIITNRPISSIHAILKGNLKPQTKIKSIIKDEKKINKLMELINNNFDD